MEVVSFRPYKTLYISIAKRRGKSIKNFVGHTDRRTDRQTNLVIEAPSRSLKTGRGGIDSRKLVAKIIAIKNFTFSNTSQKLSLLTVIGRHEDSSGQNLEDPGSAENIGFIVMFQFGTV